MICIAQPTRAVLASPSGPGRGISRRSAAWLASENEQIGHCSQSPHKVTSGDGLLSVCSSQLTENQIRRRRRRQWSIAGVESESHSEFEVDQDKAREALKSLDRQFESISKKRASTPKITTVNLSSNSLRDEIRVKESTPEISESFLAYTAFALLAFTIFYNILFLTVIKPSVDIPQDVVVGVASDQSGGGGGADDMGEVSQPQSLLSSQQTLPESLVYE